MRCCRSRKDGAVSGSHRPVVAKSVHRDWFQYVFIQPRTIRAPLGPGAAGTPGAGWLAQVPYLSGTVGIVPTRCVFGNRRHCCLTFAQCVSRSGWGGMRGIFEKPLKRAIWNTLSLHVILTTCLRFSSVSDGACVACCLCLSTTGHILNCPRYLVVCPHC